MANGFRSLASNLIGNGITPRWVLQDIGLKEQIQQCWLEWTNTSDFEGRCDFYGLQMLIAQTLMQSGKMGIELGPCGRRVAYHLYAAHPGEINCLSSQTIRVPADEILHIYRMDRPGQRFQKPLVAIR